eukprot:PITA_09106
MKYCDVMCQNLNKTSSSLRLMEEPWEDIMWAKQQCKRFYALGCGGRHCIRIQRRIVGLAEAQPVKDCTSTTTKVIFEYVLTRFGCPKILMSDRGTHFLNETISAMMEEFQVYHQKSTPYHLQADGMVEAFNKILENALMKVCNTQGNDWDVHVPMVLWAYRTTCKKLTGQTPFRLVYGVEVVMPMEYIVRSMHIAAFIGLADHKAMEERLA